MISPHFFVVIFAKVGYTKDKEGGVTMEIRCATKAIIIENGAILLNRCKDQTGMFEEDITPDCKSRCSCSDVSWDRIY